MERLKMSIKLYDLKQSPGLEYKYFMEFLFTKLGLYQLFTDNSTFVISLNV